MTTTAPARRRCPVCSVAAAAPGKSWCGDCRDAYDRCRRILQSFRMVRPADPAVLRANIRYYRRRAAKCLPLFGRPG